MIRRFLTTIFLLALLAIFFSGNTFGASCESCHSSSMRNPSGGWVYHPPIISLVHDPFYSIDTEFNVRLLITGASDYDVRSVSATLELSNSGLDLVSDEKGTEGTNSRGEPYIEWTLKTKDEGSTELSAIVEYEVYYRHKNPGSSDQASYFDRVSTTILTADLDLSVSPGTLIFKEVGDVRELYLDASDQVSNIRITPPEVLQDSLSIEMVKNELDSGEGLVVRITLTNRTDIISKLKIEWQETGGEKSTSIEIVIADPGSGEDNIDIFWEVGKYTGIAAFILLITEYFTGGTSALKKSANRFFGSAKRRIDLHCAISFIILILVIIHFVVLFYGPFRELIFQWEVVLGELALLIMIVVSLNGIFQRKLVKWMGFQNWKRIHAWGSGIIKVLVIVHMLLYGSHFLWFRNLIGYG